jgi:endonuclease/exonuclease/phosphatase family metal-dependent hydrolase
VGATAATSYPSFTVRVLTLNVWNLDANPARQDQLRTALAALQPDLVALQEVVKRPDCDQLHQLTTGMGLDAVHQFDLTPAPDDQRGAHGIALASRWPIARTECLLLPQVLPAADMIPCALAAVISLPVAAEVLFICAKPAWRLDAEAERLSQARALGDLDDHLRRPVPTIIAGDFDATPDADSLRYLTGRGVIDGHSVHYHDAWTIAGDHTSGHTWTSDNPLAADLINQIVGQPRHARRIDYILIGSQHAHPNVRALVRDCRVVLTDPPVSDHYGVLADIAIEL